MDPAWAVERLTAGGMSEADFESACVLHHAAFPKPGRTVADVMGRKRGAWMGASGGGAVSSGAGLLPGPLVSETLPERFVVRDPEDPSVWWANAGTLTRRIALPDGGEWVVQGLMDVATSPAARGRGLGVAVVRAAWAAVDSGALPLCLFETGEARPFYEKLGARVVTNRFIDSTHPKRPEVNPFTDELEMIYPADAAWPEGTIDLRGPGY
ncbi:MAG: GNAT family N-acetyltransferase [Planctomycetota bacterium]